MEKNNKNQNIVTRAMAKKLIPLDFSDLRLTKKEFLFVIIYCTTNFNTYEAMSGAGYTGTKKQLQTRAHEVHNRPQVSTAINRILNAAIKPYKDRIEYKVMEAYYRRAFYRVEDFYNDNGTIRPLSELDEEHKELIDGVTRRFYGKDADVEVVEYVLPNRDTALQTLGRMVWGQNGAGVDPELPADIRDTLAEIRKKVNSQIGEGSRVTTTLTAKRVVETGPRGRGRPRKAPAEVEVKL